VPLGSGDNPDATFGGTAPLKFGKAKNSRKSVRFTTTFDFDRNISRIDAAINKQ